MEVWNYWSSSKGFFNRFIVKESYGWHEENGQENFSSGPENRLLQIILVCSHKHPGKSDTVRIESRGYYKKNGVQRIKSV